MVVGGGWARDQRQGEAGWPARGGCPFDGDARRRLLSLPLCLVGTPLLRPTNNPQAPNYFTPNASRNDLSSALSVSLRRPNKLPFHPSRGTPPPAPDARATPPPAEPTVLYVEVPIDRARPDPDNEDDEPRDGADSLDLDAWAAAINEASSDSGDDLAPPSSESSSPFRPPRRLELDPPPWWSRLPLLFLPPPLLPPAPLPFLFPPSSPKSCWFLRLVFGSTHLGLFVRFHSSRSTSNGFERPWTSRLGPIPCDLHVSDRKHGVFLSLITPHRRSRSMGSAVAREPHR